MPDSFQNPIGGNKPPDPYDYRVEEIQRDKSERDAPPPPPKRPFIAAMIIHAFKKFFDLFEKGQQEEPFSYSEADARAHLLEILVLFERLQMEDHSQDLFFLKQLSQLWSLLLDDALQFSRRTPVAMHLHELMQSIQEYPEGEEHSLGYYLLEYAGQNWMPFPYIEMIQGLWKDSQKNGEKSHLAEWCKDLSEIINSLDNDQKHS